MNFNISHLFSWISGIFRCVTVNITFQIFNLISRLFMLSDVTSIVLYTPVIWCHRHLTQPTICKTVTIYRSTRHAVLEMTIFHSSKINTFHPNTQHSDKKQNLNHDNDRDHCAQKILKKSFSFKTRRNNFGYFICRIAIQGNLKCNKNSFLEHQGCHSVVLTNWLLWIPYILTNKHRFMKF
jgi:hypothetical protein